MFECWGWQYCHVMYSHQLVFFQCGYSFQASMCSPNKGSCTRFPPHAHTTQSAELCSTCPSFPVAKTDRKSLLSAHSCHKSQHAWHVWSTGLSGQQIAWLVGSEGARLCNRVLPWQLQWAEGQKQDWFALLLLPVDLTYVFLMCQHLYVSQL